MFVGRSWSRVLALRGLAKGLADAPVAPCCDFAVLVNKFQLNLDPEP